MQVEQADEALLSEALAAVFEHDVMGPLAKLFARASVAGISW